MRVCWRVKQQECSPGSRPVAGRAAGLSRHPLCSTRCSWGAAKVAIHVTPARPGIKPGTACALSQAVHLSLSCTRLRPACKQGQEVCFHSKENPAVQERLDPIDWATFEPHLWASAAALHQRLGMLFGALPRTRTQPEVPRPVRPPCVCLCQPT